MKSSTRRKKVREISDERKLLIEELYQKVNEYAEERSKDASSFEDYVDSFGYGGEAEMSFDDLENKVLGEYLKKTWNINHRQVILALNPYVTTLHEEGYSSVDNSILSFNIGSIEDSFELNDFFSEEEKEFFDSFSEEEKAYFISGVDNITDDGEVCFTHSGSINLVLDADGLVAEMSTLTEAERLTDPLDFIRNFPLKEILDEQ